MNLGIDLDGVVYNSEEWFKAFGEVYVMAKVGNGPIDKTTSDIQDRFGLADDEARALRLKYLPVQIMTSPLMPYAKEGLKRLEKDHNKLKLVNKGCEVGYSEDRYAKQVRKIVQRLLG